MKSLDFHGRQDRSIFILVRSNDLLSVKGLDVLSFEYAALEKHEAVPKMWKADTNSCGIAEQISIASGLNPTKRI
jgi:hypothetical protein